MIIVNVFFFYLVRTNIGLYLQIEYKKNSIELLWLRFFSIKTIVFV